MPQLLQFAAEIGEVINTSVEDQPDLAIFRQHGLAAELAQIQNCQTPVPQRYTWPGGCPFAVRAAPGEGGEHRGNRRRSIAGRGKTGDTAHEVIVSDRDVQPRNNKAVTSAIRST